MTTELTLREKVLAELVEYRDVFTDEDTVNAIADLLSATGAPAYCRVADDLRGVVREEAVDLSAGFQTDSLKEVSRWADIEASAIGRYLGQFDKRGEGK